MCENEETFFVSLESSDRNVMVGGFSTSAVVISDDDGKLASSVLATEYILQSIHISARVRESLCLDSWMCYLAKLVELL